MDSSQHPAPGKTQANPFHWRINTSLGEVRVDADDASARDWLTYVSQAAAQIAQIWPQRRAPITVRIFSSDADFESSVTDLDGQDVAATDATGILIGPSADRALTSLGKVSVLAHEMTHWELSQFGSRAVPLWVQEGLAQWSAERGASLTKTALWPKLAELQGARLPTGPPQDAVFTKEPAQSYEAAAAYISYLDQYAGLPFIRRLANTKQGSMATFQQMVTHSLKPHTPSFAQWLSSVLSG